MTELTEERLSEIEERAQKATVGSWRRWTDEEGEVCVSGPTSLIGQFGGNYGPDTGPVLDADFVAHARQDIPDLTKEVRRRSHPFGSTPQECCTAKGRGRAGEGRAVGRLKEYEALEMAVRSGWPVRRTDEGFVIDMSEGTWAWDVQGQKWVGADAEAALGRGEP